MFVYTVFVLSSRYWVFRSWGRVGTTIGGNKLDKFYDKNSAMDNFCSVYEEKTGNAWASTNFTKYPNKFYPLEIDYGQVKTALRKCLEKFARGSYEYLWTQDEEAVKMLTASAGAKSQLAKPVQDLIRLIFDVESMKKAMVEFEVGSTETEKSFDVFLDSVVTLFPSTDWPAEDAFGETE